MKSIALALVSICAVAANAADIGRVIVRQQWPWSTKINVDFELSGVSASAPADISLRCYNGSAEISAAKVAAALSGKRFALTAGGTYTLTLDPAVLFQSGTKTVPDFRVTVTAAATAPIDTEPIYRIIDIETGDTDTLCRADFYNDPDTYGTYETSFSVFGGTTTLSDVFIWTGVTNNSDYTSSKLVLRKIPAAGAEWPYGSASSLITGRLTNDYWIGVFPLTQEQYYRLAGSYGGAHTTYEDHERFPVAFVAWRDFVGWSYAWPNASASADGVSASSPFGILAARSGMIVNFPTEMQWEFAARGGATTGYYGISDAKSVMWFKTNAGSHPMAVGQKRPNAFGLYDTLGNVREVCRDWYAGGLPTTVQQTYEEYPGVDSAAAADYDSQPQKASRGGYYNSASGSPPTPYSRNGIKATSGNTCDGVRVWAIDR